MNHVGSSVNLHIIVDDKILLLRRNSQRWMDGKLQIPGGHVEAGEPPLTAILREANEELGIKLTPNDVKHLATATVREGQTEYFAVQFQLTNPSKYTFSIMEPRKCKELVWASIQQPPEDTIDLFKTVIEQTHVRHQSYLEIGYV